MHLNSLKVWSLGCFVLLGVDLAHFPQVAKQLGTVFILLSGPMHPDDDPTKKVHEGSETKVTRRVSPELVHLNESGYASPSILLS